MCRRDTRASRAIRQTEDAWHVGVPVEADTTLYQLEVRVRDRVSSTYSLDVIAWLACTRRTSWLDLAVGQIAQPDQPLIANDIDCPAND